MYRLFLHNIERDELRIGYELDLFSAEVAYIQPDVNERYFSTYWYIRLADEYIRLMGLRSADK